jgi:hypothetical protein
MSYLSGDFPFADNFSLLTITDSTSSDGINLRLSNIFQRSVIAASLILPPVYSVSTMSAAPLSNEAHDGEQFSKNVIWYTPGQPKLPENTKELLLSWSKINPEDSGIEKHVENVVGKTSTWVCSTTLRGLRK